MSLHPRRRKFAIYASDRADLQSVKYLHHPPSGSIRRADKRKQQWRLRRMLGFNVKDNSLKVISVLRLLSAAALLYRVALHSQRFFGFYLL